MLVQIPELLSGQQLEAVTSVLRRGQFVDGRLSAGRNASRNKLNLELDSGDESYGALNDVVMTSLVQHPRYLQTAFPARICAPIYARYTEGMAYGGHIDDPLMGPPQSRLRSDISITVFLSPPEAYEGGELCITDSQGESAVKLPAGHAVLYPSTSYHRVNPVTSGERLVALSWVQSHIRRADQREILIQLDQAREQLAAEEHAALAQVDIAFANLFRLWAET